MTTTRKRGTNEEFGLGTPGHHSLDRRTQTTGGILMPGLYLRKFADEDRSLAGVEHVGEPASYAEVSTRVVTEGIAEGWIEGEDEEVVHRPGGPSSDPWRVTHTFRHFSHLRIAGIRYRVVHQPDKYADPGDDDTPVGEPTGEIYSEGNTRVDWFYGIERVED